jgi:hypothetical protein
MPKIGLCLMCPLTTDPPATNGLPMVFGRQMSYLSAIPTKKRPPP